VWKITGDKAILRSSSGTLKDTCGTWGHGSGIKYVENDQGQRDSDRLGAG
jgi:hypothetical protein